MGSSASSKIFKHVFTQGALRMAVSHFDSDLLEGIFLGIAAFLKSEHKPFHRAH